MDTLNINAESIAPLLMHADRYANPLDPLTKQHKQLTQQQIQENIEARARLSHMVSMFGTAKKIDFPKLSEIGGSDDA